MIITKNMDTYVPSPNLINATFSPIPNSIYDQDKLEVFSCNSKMNVNNDDSDVCGSYEETHSLDGNLEDSSLKNILTSELLNSISSSSVGSLAQTNLWGNNKSNIVDFQDTSMMDQPFPIAMESDLLSDLLNIDSNDSKFSLQNFDFDFMTSNPSSSCQTPVPSVSESKVDIQELPPMDRISRSNKDVTISSSNVTSDNIGQGFILKRFNMKQQHFPPRKSEPPVGIVTPVKVEESEGYLEMQRRSSQTVERGLKKEGNRASHPLAEHPQTVPLFKFSDHAEHETTCRKREFTTNVIEDKWDEMKLSDQSSLCQPKRRRYDSGSSWQTSEDGDECIDNLHNDYDSDDDNSDLDADLAHLKPGNCESLIDCGKKQKQYFWQYNVQAKGPKGTRLKLLVDSPSDPHILNDFEDPVFDEGNTIVAGIRHGGKARKGDGNEVTPNPLKLFKIGHQLLRLNKKINGCQLGSDVPLTQRNEARREKNKLASRACRLKKKAQHEANKIKLRGLETEHGQINSVLRLIWPELRKKAKFLQADISKKCDSESSLTSKINSLISDNLDSGVACNTTDFVNTVIMNVEKGDLSGGLNIKSRKT